MTANKTNCTQLSFMAPVRLADDADKNNFEIIAYTGAVVDRWYGKLAIDIAGITAKKQIPILMGHNPDRIVGYSTDTSNADNFIVSGRFSKVTDAAKEVQALAEEGFPWQASIGVRPVKTLSLEKDGTHDVNGQTITGPAEVWLESVVFETSFVPLGADENTSVSRLSKFIETEAPQGETLNIKEEENQMEFTLETLTAEAPDLLTSIQSDAKQAGITQERERAAALLAIDDVDEDARKKAITEGLSVDAAYKLFFEAEKLKKQTNLEELEGSSGESVGQKGKKKTDDDKKTFMQAVDEFQAEKKCTRTEALQAVIKANPDLHAEFIGGK